MTSLLYPTREVHDIPRDLLRLQTSIALIFDGNLRARARRLDPDTFAVEARRTERERLGLDRRFTDVLGALSAALDGKPELDSPVFVLPVDDLDLNPGDCVPLLRLLRSAHSPHLVVIMAADVGLLTTVLRLKYRGDFARISDPLTLADEDRIRADDLADSAFRKHLPPSQQVHLALVEPAFALSYPPKAAEGRPILRAMSSLRLPPDNVRLSLDRWFGEVPGPHDAGRVGTGLLPPPTAADTGPVDEAALKADLAGFSWPEVLRLPMRQVVDLHLASTADETAPARARDAEEPAMRRVARIRLQRWRSAASDGHRFSDPSPGPSPRLSTDDVMVGPLVIRTSKFHGWRVQTRGGPCRRSIRPPTWDAWSSRATTSTWTRRRPGHRTWDQCERRSCRQTRGATRSPFPGHACGTRRSGPTTRRSLVAPCGTSVEHRVRSPFGSWIAVMTAQLFPRPGLDGGMDRRATPELGAAGPAARRAR